jgi:hypothetical protein
MFAFAAGYEWNDSRGVPIAGSRLRREEPIGRISRHALVLRSPRGATSHALFKTQGVSFEA